MKSAAIDLMENPHFRDLIEGFSEVIKTSAEQGLDAARQRCTAFFLSADDYRADVESIQHLAIEGKDRNQIPLSVYAPKAEHPLPVIVYFHRGGWIFGNNTESEPVCRLLAHELQCVVVAVEYRLAPEHPFPQPLDDCYAATEWVHQNAVSLGADPERLILCGESAGGNLAAAVCLLARDRKGPAIATQLLIYPMIASTPCDAAYDACPDRHFITKGGIQFMWGAYLQSPENARNPYASLDCARDLTHLPSTVVVTAAYDPLCQEGAAYADSLQKAGVYVRHMCIPEAIHGCLDLPIYTTEQKIAWIQKIKAMLPILNRDS